MDDLSQQILKLLREHPGLSSSAIAISGYSDREISDAIAYLLKHELVTGISSTNMGSQFETWIGLNISHDGRKALTEAQTPRMRKFFSSEWRFLVSTSVALLALAISIWRK